MCVETNRPRTSSSHRGSQGEPAELAGNPKTVLLVATSSRQSHHLEKFKTINIKVEAQTAGAFGRPANVSAKEEEEPPHEATVRQVIP